MSVEDTKEAQAVRLVAGVNTAVVLHVGPEPLDLGDADLQKGNKPPTSPGQISMGLRFQRILLQPPPIVTSVAAVPLHRVMRLPNETEQTRKQKLSC